MDELRPLMEEARKRGCDDLLFKVVAAFVARDARNGWTDGMNDAQKAKVRARASEATSTDAAAGYGTATK